MSLEWFNINLEPLYLATIYQVCQFTKKERTCKKYGLLPLKIAESDTVSLGHGMCGSGESLPFAIRTSAKSHYLLALTIIDQSTGWFEIVKATNKFSNIYPEIAS
jgi:hypothetical protein